MQVIRKFILKTVSNPNGVVFFYDAKSELFCGLEIKEADMQYHHRQWVIQNIKLTLNDFFEWQKTFKNECIEMEMKITFSMFWDKYDDKERSSKKRCEKMWGKYDESHQVKAYYFIEVYNRNRGNAEKKYCETYLNAEQWNN